MALVGVCIYIWLALGCPTPLGPHSSEDAYGFGWHVVLGRGGVGLGLRVACLWGWEAVGGIGRCMRFISTPHTHTHTHTHNLPSPSYIQPFSLGTGSVVSMHLPPPHTYTHTATPIHPCTHTYIRAHIHSPAAFGPESVVKVDISKLSSPQRIRGMTFLDLGNHKHIPLVRHTYTHTTRAHTHTSAHTRAHAYTHINTHTNTHAHTHTNTRARAYTHIPTHTRTHTRTHTHTHIHTRTHSGLMCHSSTKTTTCV